MSKYIHFKKITDSLTPDLKKWLEEYEVCGFNGTEATQRVWPHLKRRSANYKAVMIKKLPVIKQILKRRSSRFSKNTGITKDTLIGRLERAFELCNMKRSKDICQIIELEARMIGAFVPVETKNLNTNIEISEDDKARIDKWFEENADGIFTGQKVSSE